MHSISRSVQRIIAQVSYLRGVLVTYRGTQLCQINVVNFWESPPAQSQCLRPRAWCLHKEIPRAEGRRQYRHKQAFQFANLHSHEPTMIINNVIGLAKFAKAFKVPVILTTVVEARGGRIIKGLQDVFPEQKPVDRTYINTWQDKRVVDLVKATGSRRLVLAALWPERCWAMPTIQALGEGYDVYIVTDASGGVSVEAHDMAVP